MKKLILIALISMLPCIVFAQTGVNWKKFVSGVTLAASANYTITTSASYDSWSVFFKIGTTTSTTSTVKVQVSPDGVEWIDYANMSTATIASQTNIAFEDEYISQRWMRFVFTIQAGKSVPVDGWYVFKKD
jgi:hypothetical protein